MTRKGHSILHVGPFFLYSPLFNPSCGMALMTLQKMKTVSKRLRVMRSWLKEFFILGWSITFMETKLPVRPKRATTRVTTPLIHHFQVLRL